MSLTLSIVIPAFNEADNLARTLPIVLHQLPVRADEIIVADDGSRDATAEVVQRFAAQDPRVRLVALPRNGGKGAAVKAGLAAARGDAILYTDADLIYHLDDLPHWLARLDTHDIVNGNRRLADSVFLVPTRLFPYVAKRARLGLYFNAVVRTLLPIATSDTQSGLKLLRREIARRFVEHSVVDDFSFDVEFFALAGRWGARVAEVPVRLDYRNEVSTVRLARDGWRMLRRIFAIRRRVRRIAAGGTPSLVVTADDYGISSPVSAGIREAHTAGIVTATSVMTHLPAAAQEMAALRALPSLAVGVHLTATAGAPLTAAAQRLAGRTGLMSPRRLLWCYLTSPRRTVAAVRAEWTAQIERLREAGFTPTHLDSHHHVHHLPGLQRVTIDLATQFHIPRVRAARDPRFLRSPWHWPIYWLARLFAWRARTRCLQVTEHFTGAALLRAEAKLPVLRAVLATLRPGVTELYCHPGHDDPTLADPYRAPRSDELAALKAARDEDRRAVS